MPASLRLKLIPGSITAAKGFRAAGVFCDIKRLGTGKGSAKGKKRDLALIFSTAPAAVAGLFTTNQICAAPVKLSIPRAASGEARAIVANSGNANACTGSQGLENAWRMAQWAGRELGVAEEKVLVCSTGRIGLQLPMVQVEKGIRSACAQLGGTLAHARAAVEAIMTSDTRRKEIAVEFNLHGRTVRVGGICKGAGMIQPGMSQDGRRPAARPHATMLCFLTTDVAIEVDALKFALEQAVAQSFNRITVDGDMSTNDSVIILANGQAQNPAITLQALPERATFQSALNHVTLELAKKIVRDGEGASRFITVHVKSAASFDDADAAARAVANSALVKTSWCGGDPNWGRILDALGYSSAWVVEEKIDLGYSRPGEEKILYALRQGQPASTPLARLKKIVTAAEFDLHIDLHLGESEAIIYSADLTEEYIDFNKGE